MLTETKADLLNDLKLSADHTDQVIETLIAGDSSYLRDLRMNLKTALQVESLSRKEAYLTAHAVAVNEKHSAFIQGFAELSREHGATEAEIAEAAACASLLAANNVLYRFRHFTHKDEYQNMPARMRMNIMMRPVLGKEFFELLSTAISAVNGCEQCVNSHENHLREMGMAPEKIFDAIRIAAIVVSATKVL